ncbi:DUF222 domain-containing protein [Cryobacterium sp. Y11]|uniref:DUF222 domain-containing protein n=1 Tax=Cryobacterium sp. Y11 TaxID=2045016 RepID=UPI001304D3EB|nr:DUF222 domain-containing protein [Cryobacterium sp. Y11]
MLIPGAAAFGTEPFSAHPFSADSFTGDTRFDGDRRTAGEKRADILRSVCEAAARDPQTPTMGGAAPTVMVHINAADLDQGRGVGWIDGIEAPISFRRVKELICTSGYKHALFGDNGDVLYLGTTIRCFTATQRAAIAARDEGCIIPGCNIPARWCEVHYADIRIMPVPCCERWGHFVGWGNVLRGQAAPASEPEC